MKKVLRALALLVTFALLLPVCLAEDAQEDPVLATVGGYEIRLSEVQEYASLLYSYGMTDSEEDYVSAFDYVALYSALPNLKVSELGYEAILGDRLETLYAELAAEFDAAIDEYCDYLASESEGSDPADFRQEALSFYEGYGITRESFIESSLVNDAFSSLINSLDIAVTADEVQAEYDSEMAVYAEYFENDVEMYELYQYYGYAIPYRPAGYRGITHILLNADEALLADYADAEDEGAKAEAAKAVVASIQDQIDAIYARLDAGESFVSLIAELGIDPGMQDEENLLNGYAVHEKSMMWAQEFTDGSFSEKMQKPGDVSDPVVTSYGVHILYYLRDYPAGPDPLDDEMYAQIEESIRQMKIDDQLAAWLSEYEIVYTEVYDQYVTP